mmetsp:Transcript_23660/g.37836  ORF Transcript_23660/g.37836 Transcript_23660/m.37836 type:complete len:95 (-) Transcript_23660:17-301(-)
MLRVTSCIVSMTSLIQSLLLGASAKQQDKFFRHSNEYVKEYQAERLILVIYCLSFKRRRSFRVRLFLHGQMQTMMILFLMLCQLFEAISISLAC